MITSITTSLTTKVVGQWYIMCKDSVIGFPYYPIFVMFCENPQMKAAAQGGTLIPGSWPHQDHVIRFLDDLFDLYKVMES